MNQQGEDRCIEIARYIIDTGATVRAAAKKFGVSKSTVHKDVTSRLLQVNRSLHTQVHQVWRPIKTNDISEVALPPGKNIDSCEASEQLLSKGGHPACHASKKDLLSKVFFHISHT